jgi:endonuclease YncB( thermonuclease family)
MKLWILGLLLAAGAAMAAPAPRTLEGVVKRVFDGDTLLVVDAQGEPVTIRLNGIDAPEICQPHGPEARQALEELVLNQRVVALTRGQDDAGRTLAKVMRAGSDVGDRMVRDGHAWSYRYRDDKGPYVAQERMALALYRGLHATRQAISPREFRRRHGRCASAG